MPTQRFTRETAPHLWTSCGELIPGDDVLYTRHEPGNPLGTEEAVAVWPDGRMGFSGEQQAPENLWKAIGDVPASHRYRLEPEMIERSIVYGSEISIGIIERW
mgnify:CR=1 FL=1